MVKSNMVAVSLDHKDLRILEELQRNAKQSIKEIARKIGSPITTVHSKIKKMEKIGIIKNYRAILDANKLGYSTLAFIFVAFSREAGISQRVLAKRISELSEVQEVHIITGDWDILLKVRVRNVEELAEFVVDKLRSIPGVEKTLTCVALETEKETTYIDLRKLH